MLHDPPSANDSLTELPSDREREAPLRTLIVCARAPWRRRRGDQLRAHQFLAALGPLGEVDFLVPGTTPVDASERLPEGFEGLSAVHTYRRGVPRRLWGLLTAWAKGRALQQGLYSSPDLVRRLGELAPAYDLVVIQLIRLAPALGRLEGTTATVDLVDSLALNYLGRRNRASGPMRWVLGREARLLAEQEAALLEDVPVTVVAERDRRHLLNARPNARVDVLRLPVAADVSAAGGVEEFDVVFSGNLGYWVNRDALRWWIEQVWPRLRIRREAVTMLVTGARADRRVRRWCRAPGVTLVENPEDLRAQIRRARVAVAPLRGGAGVPVKVLEAMSEGVAAVASEWAAQGLDPDVGSALTVAPERPDSWVDEVERLLVDRSARERQQIVARQFVESRHGQEVCARDVRRWALSLVDRDGSRS